jgi:hypothetical protein
MVICYKSLINIDSFSNSKMVELQTADSLLVALE